MKDDPRIPLPRAKPPEGQSHMAFAFRNSDGARVTTWGLLTDDACKQIMAIIVRDKKPPADVADNVRSIKEKAA